MEERTSRKALSRFVNFSLNPSKKLLIFGFKVFVDKECGPQKVRAFGPGLSGGKVGDSADFVVETTGTDVGQLGEWTI